VKQRIPLPLPAVLAVTLCSWPLGGPAAAQAAEARSWVEIHTPVGDGFRRAFATRSSHDAEAWARELGDFYRTDGRLVFRGVCNDAARTLPDFVNMFVSVSENLVSKGIEHAYEQGAAKKSDYDLRRVVLADLSRFDRDAYMYSLFEAVDVHQLGPVPGNEEGYAQSYGFSTSWSFWMAAEFAGVYPGDKSCANMMVFGMYPANYFVDYANLEAVDARFRRQYPDEKEVLGAGAADPDSLMLAARLESRGSATPAITEVLLRDPTNPAQLHYYEGSIDVLDREVAEGWALLQADDRDIEAVFRESGVRPPTPPSIPRDCELRVVPARPLVVRAKGIPREPTRTIPLDYGVPLFRQDASATQPRP